MRRPNIQIHYLWIEEYRHYKRQGFNFSGEFMFELKEDGSCLTVRRNPSFVPGLWQHDNITNLTAVVGANGAGKTSLLDLIRFTFPKGETLPDPKTKRLVVAVEFKGKFYVFFNHRGAKKMRVVGKASGVDWAPAYPIGEGGRSGTAFGECFDDVSFINYSNVFIPDTFSGEEELDGWPRHGVNDISTRFHVLRDAVSLTNDSSTAANRIIAYATMETLRNMDFIASDVSADKLPFALPFGLFVSPLSIDDKNLVEAEKELFNKIRRPRPRVVTAKNAFLDQLATVALLNYVRDTRSEKIASKVEKAASDASLKTVDIVMRVFEEKDLSFGPVNSARKELLEFVRDKFDEMDFMEDGSAIRFRTKEGVTARLKQLLALYSKSALITPFMRFRWSHPLSSGEQSLLTLYSRFWSITGFRPPINKQVREAAVILIDEGDLYFHPAWQKQLIRRLLDFLAKDAFPNCDLQIIFTAHSPFCLSDIPKNHVLFLARNEDKSVRVLPADNDMRNTFAANIHDLLGDSFFLEYSLMGDFARERVRDVISWLQDKPPSDSGALKWLNAEKVGILIDQIGEPLLRQRLLEMYEAKAKRLDDPELLERVIKRRTAELRMLKASRKVPTRKMPVGHD